MLYETASSKKYFNLPGNGVLQQNVPGMSRLHLDCIEK